MGGRTSNESSVQLSRIQSKKQVVWLRVSGAFLRARHQELPVGYRRLIVARSYVSKYSMILPPSAAANVSSLQAFTFPLRLEYCSHDNVSLEIHSRALSLLIDGAMSQI